MKKIIMLILTLIMAFTLAACGSSEVAEEAEESKTSKEDMLAVAEECSATDVQNESINENDNWHYYEAVIIDSEK